VLASAPRTRAHSLVSSTRPIAPFDPLKVFAEARGANRALWLRPGNAEAIVAVGAAHELNIASPGDRFAAASRAWRSLLDEASVDDPARLPWTGPLLLGGFRFDPLRPATSLWRGFAADRLVLPEQLYVLHGGSAWLTTTRVASADGPSPVAAMDAPPARGLPPADWQSLVEAVAADIRHERTDVGKVVLARTRTLRATGELDPAIVAGHLASAYPTCTVFAIGHGGATFVGATPERLVSVADGSATTMALAGSAARGDTDAEDRALGEALLGDAKERAEHEFVVQALRAGLAQVSSRVISDTEPRVRKLPNLQHLLTPVHATLRPGRTVLDVVQRLHPSPAVGGVPRDPALKLIREREALDRGWYGGPVGWLNRAGDGDFVVGIRSALLHGSEATLFAGCGIVADSVGSAELAESNWKLRPMLSALGVADGA
jgi:isochorismate synthase